MNRLRQRHLQEYDDNMKKYDSQTEWNRGKVARWLIGVVVVGIVGFGTIQLVVVGVELPTGRDLQNLGLLAVRFLALIAIIGAFYLIQKSLVRGADRIVPKAEAATQNPKSGEAETNVISAWDSLKIRLGYSLCGLLIGAIIGFALFWLGGEVWDAMTSEPTSSISPHASGDPIDGWASGVTRMMIAFLFVSPFAFAGFRIGSKWAFQK